MANITENLRKIKEAIFGREVRNSIHDAIYAINNENIDRLDGQDKIINDNTVRQDLLEKKYDEQIKNIAAIEPQNAEIVDARNGYDTLGNVIKQKIYHFDNVDNMKRNILLFPGDVCKTLGYYEANDGGGGTYHIVNDDILEDDGGSVHLLDNGLKAKLIDENRVNVKQFGAKGDNKTDDTLAFKNAIAYNAQGTIEIPDGNYIISETIDILDTICLKGLDGIPKISYNSTGCMFLIKGHAKNIEDNATYVIKEEKKPIFSNLLLWCNGEQINNFYGVENTIGIKYESNSEMTNARAFFSNVNIAHFDVGLEFANVNCYILSYDRVSFTRNNVAILCPANQTNSGERMNFTDCIFDSNRIVCKFLEYGYDLHFLNCSIDYNLCFLHSLVQSASRMIDLNGCHYETKFTGDDSIPHGFLWGVMPGSQIVITNSMIFTKITEKQFNKRGMAGKCNITINGSRIMYWDQDYRNFTSKHLFFSDAEDILQAYCNEQGYSDMGLPFNFTNSLTLYPAFDSLEVGYAKVENYFLVDKNTNSSHYIVTDAVNIASYSIEEANEVTKMKSLKVIPADTSKECVLTMRTNEYLEYKFLIYHAIVCKNVSSFRFRTIYYNEDKEQISMDAFTEVILDELEELKSDEIYVIPRGYRMNKPVSKQNIKYIRYEIQIRNGSKTTLKPELCCFMPYTI